MTGDGRSDNQMGVTEVGPALTAPEALPRETEVVIVGSGFSGLAMAHRLKQAGRHDFVILERAREVGGTWRDNTYPGCACDVPSHAYSFSFAPNPEWSSTYSPQAEIAAYIRAVAEREGLLEHIRFGCELEEASWDPAAARWSIRTSAGPIDARVLVAAAGPFSEASIPELTGLDDFAGTVFHSASWDHDHELAGERVAVVGTGASAIQIVPAIQPTVARLRLFQRTPAWVMPRRARRLTRAERALYRLLPSAQRLMSRAIIWARELYAVPMLRVPLTRVLRRIGIAHLVRQVRDPELRAKLTPDYAPGCKRILVSDEYFPAVAQPNVELVTDGIAEVRERSIVAQDGREYEVDAIVFATGFNVTAPPIAERVYGRDGDSLATLWRDGMQAHRGTTVAGFPNLFFLLGPNTGLGHNPVTDIAEAQAGYVFRALEHMDARGVDALEPIDSAQRSWNDELQRRMKGTVWLDGGCASWYLDRNGRNTTIWPGFSFKLRRALREFRPDEHVAVTRAPDETPAPAELLA